MRNPPILREPSLHFAVILSVLLVVASPAAHSAPALRYSWDDCSPLIVDRNWAGQGVYSQVLSATGLATGLRSVFLGSEMGGNADPWNYASWCRFQQAPIVTTSLSGTSCPAAAVTHIEFEHVPWITQPRLSFRMEVTLDPAATYDPAQRYTIARVGWDHTISYTDFDSYPGHCGGAEWARCWALFGEVDYGSGYEPATMESDYLTWQGFNSIPDYPDCPGAVPARAATWGEIKAQYR